MASVINTNVMSLNAQRNLTMSQTELATSLQRLSSGLRINSAKDDAAGLAISDRFTTQIRGLNQAARNANDAISLSQTAEGALAEMSNNLQRIRELAVQSANATNSSSDRAALDLEVQQRLAEIDRIANQTAFNGQKILDGSFGNAAFQVGANVGETITLDLSTSMRQNTIGAMAEVSSTVDLNTLANETGAGATSSFATITPTDFAAIAATAGTDTIAFTAAATAGDTVTLNGITFSFTENGAADTFTVIDATHVTIGATLGGDTTAESGALLIAAITAAKVGGTATELSGALATVSAAGAATVTITDSALGTAATVGRTLVASDTANTTIVQDVTGSDVGDLIIVGNNTEITLDTNITNAAGLVTVINDALLAAGDNTVIASVGLAGEFVLTTTALGSGEAAPLIDTATYSATSTDTMLGASITAIGTDPITKVIAPGEFTIQLGDSNVVEITGTFTTAQSLVDATNTALAGNATAELNDDGTMTIYSDVDVTIAGTVGITDMGLLAFTQATGSLENTNITTVDDSNETIRRVDAALTSISDLRSTFGAIQNRFESTITNLSTAVENLSAARSRILDADFAAETANLTRAQILQQAGTAMLAQANAVPQNVLSLLQG